MCILPSNNNPGVENAGLLPLTRYGEVYALPSHDLAIGRLHALAALQVLLKVYFGKTTFEFHHSAVCADKAVGCWKFGLNLQHLLHRHSPKQSRFPAR